MQQNATIAARRRVLPIDGEPTVSAFWRPTLQRDGHEVASTESAGAGLKLLVFSDFQGVTSNSRVPGGLNDTDAHDWLRRHRPELSGRMVSVSGDTAGAETTALLVRLGTPCVEKPFRIRQLMAAVERTIGKP